jgi:hypothetical protein
VTRDSAVITVADIDRTGVRIGGDAWVRQGPEAAAGVRQPTSESVTAHAGS